MVVVLLGNNFIFFFSLRQDWPMKDSKQTVYFCAARLASLLLLGTSALFRYVIVWAETVYLVCGVFSYKALLKTCVVLGLFVFALV